MPLDSVSFWICPHHLLFHDFQTGPHSKCFRQGKPLLLLSHVTFTMTVLSGVSFLFTHKKTGSFDKLNDLARISHCGARFL